MTRRSADVYVNWSELHYRSLEPVETVRCEPAPRRGKVARPASLPPRIARRLTRWNSESARRSRGDLIATGDVEEFVVAGSNGGPVVTLDAPWNGGFICTEPMLKVGEETGYTFPDQVAGTDVFYPTPGYWFGGEDAARDFASTVRASMPFFLPYRDTFVFPGGGWLYDDGTFHGAVDYGKKKEAYGPGIDPAFTVHAVAEGTVVAVFWDWWSGNIVIIEHEAPNGDRYRSAYFHVRNGFDHDREQALATESSIPEAQEYLKFAETNSDPLLWGTNDQVILVAPGDWVRPGETIGWSGNTGPGGAHAGLTAEGVPENPTTGNNHLHFMMTARNDVPGPASAVWVQVDAYGVYGTATNENGCYELSAEPAYERLFAPLYSSFHNVPKEYVGHYWNYFTGMGLALQTLSNHRESQRVLASGSFQKDLPAHWRARYFMTANDYQQWFETYDASGFRPRQISVTHDKSGDPRYTVIWQKLSGEGISAHHGISDAAWEGAAADAESWGMRVEDHVVYVVEGERLHAGVFVTDDDRDVREAHDKSSDEFQEIFDANHVDDYDLVSVNVTERPWPQPTGFGGIWRKKMPGKWRAHHRLTPAEYQTAYLGYRAEGFRLHRVQGYDSSTRLAAIWTKP